MAGLGGLGEGGGGWKNGIGKGKGKGGQLVSFIGVGRIQ